MTKKPTLDDWKALADKESRGKDLSRDTPELNREGRAAPAVMTKRDNRRVSLSNRPSAPPFMSPQPSATTKVSASFSASRCSVLSASVVSTAVTWTE